MQMQDQTSMEGLPILRRLFLRRHRRRPPCRLWRLMWVGFSSEGNVTEYIYLVFPFISYRALSLLFERTRPML